MVRCKTDIYFLADNTGSMGNIIDDIQANATAMVNAITGLVGIDAVFGVGNYRDFPTSGTTGVYSIYYGGRYNTPIANISIGIGATVTATFAPGPVVQGTGTWPGAVTATYASPISSVTIPANGVHISAYQLVFNWIGPNTGSVTANVISSISGIISTFTSSVPSSSPWTLIRGQNHNGLVVGEVLSIQIINNSTKPIDLRWDSYFSVRSNSTPWSPYAYLHQLDPTNDVAIATDAFYGWEADFGSDYPEGWLYALDQLCEATFWRTGTYKLIVILGDSPPHDPICSSISGLAYSIDEASITAKLLANNIVVVAASVNVATPGLDDTGDAEDYEIFCGPSTILAGHGTRITAATGGYILQQPDPNEAANTIVALVTAALGNCRNMSMPFATVVGAN